MPVQASRLFGTFEKAMSRTKAFTAQKNPNKTQDRQSNAAGSHECNARSSGLRFRRYEEKVATLLFCFVAFAIVARLKYLFLSFVDTRNPRVKQATSVSPMHCVSDHFSHFQDNRTVAIPD